MDRKKRTPKKDTVTIFRRYRRVNGRVLDARAYGLRAWKLEIPADRVR